MSVCENSLKNSGHSTLTPVMSLNLFYRNPRVYWLVRSFILTTATLHFMTSLLSLSANFSMCRTSLRDSPSMTGIHLHIFFFQNYIGFPSFPTLNSKFLPSPTHYWTTINQVTWARWSALIRLFVPFDPQTWHCWVWPNHWHVYQSVDVHSEYICAPRPWVVEVNPLNDPVFRNVIPIRIF